MVFRPAEFRNILEKGPRYSFVPIVYKHVT